MKLLLKAVLAVVVGTALGIPGREQCGKLQSPSYPYPWIVQLSYQNADGEVIDGSCDGVLISDRVVLTTAVCVKPPSGHSVVSILPNLGDPAGSAVAVAEAIPHPDYSQDSPLGSINRIDLGLLVLSAGVKLGEDIQPICLPPASPEPADSQLTLVGRLFNADQKKTLSSSVARVDTEACVKFLGVERIAPRQVCYRTSFTAVAPGPLIWKRAETHHVYALGVYGRSSPEKDGNDTSVYERVTAHLDWINGILSKYE